MRGRWVWSVLLVGVIGGPSAVGEVARRVTPPTSVVPVVRAQWSPDAEADPLPALLVGPAEPLERARLSPPGSRGSAAKAGMAAFTLSVQSGVEGDSPSDLAFTVDGSRIVIAHRDSGNLVVLDAATRDVVAVVPISGSPNAVAVSSDGVHAVTANLFEDTASIVDLVTGSEIGVVGVGDQPGVVRITPDGQTAVVGNTVDGTLSVIDLATATVTRVIPGANFLMLQSAGTYAWNVDFTGYEITPDNATVMFPDATSDQISFFELATGANLPVPSQPDPNVIDLSPDGALAVVSHGYPASAVSVVDVPGRTITKVIATGGTATLWPSVAVNPDKTRAVVAVSNAVRVVDLVTDDVSPSLSTGSVNALLTTVDGQYCVVGNWSGSLVSYATSTIVANVLDSTTPDALAVSPSDACAATAHTLRKEHTEAMYMNGPSAYLEEVVPTGPPPEGDKPRGLAVSPDGMTAVVINNHSHNATIFDLVTRQIQAFADVGQRPGDVAISPDGTRAVVANLDSTFASVIDLTTSAVTDVPISRRGGQVAISPDGAFAYVAVVADGDGVWRIDLDTLTVSGPRIFTGNMGGIDNGLDRNSGMALSHDGATLVTCGSFTNDLSVISTAAWSEVARVPVGEFPGTAVFSPDDTTLYVANRNNDTVSVVSNAGPGSVVVDTVAVGDRPLDMAVLPDGSKLYVTNPPSKSVSVIDLTTNTVVATIPIPPTGGGGEPAGIHAAADGASVYVAANGADFHRIDPMTNAIVDTVNTARAPMNLVVDDVRGCGYTPSPWNEAVAVVCFDVLFADNFESGTTSEWSQTVP